jgi:hypothetical protein
VTIVSSPIYSRGCANVGKSTRRRDEESRIVIAIAQPARLAAPGGMRRLARVVEHELLHTQGLDHEDMSEKDLYSLGPLPEWAYGKRLRYEGRARNQLTGIT